MKAIIEFTEAKDKAGRQNNTTHINQSIYFTNVINAQFLK